MWYVYIIRSEAFPEEEYTGATANLRQRVADHNAGKSRHTAKFIPWKLVWLLGEVGTDGFAFDYDMSHFEVAGLSIPQTLPLLPNTANVHLKASTGPKGTMALPGEGVSDFPEQFRQFKRFGYNGYLTLEVSVAVQRRPGFDPVEAMRQAHRHLSQSLVEAEVSQT